MNDFFYDLDNLNNWGDVGFFNPKNLTEEQIKQLQEHLGVTADGKFGPQTTRALQEKLGVKADGKWGNVSSNAWNDAYWNEVEERNKHNRAKAAGVENPYVENVVDYVPQYEDVQEQAIVQEKARQEKIAKLESQIAMVKERIERNKRALVGKSYEDVNNKLAQLDMKKVGLRLNRNNANTDPTNLWRWNQGRIDTKEANARVDKNQIYKFNNTVDMYENMFANRDLNRMTTAEMIGELKNLESVKRDGKNVGADTSRVDAMLNKLYKALNGDTVSTPNETSTEYIGTVQDQTNASFEDFYNQKHSSKEWEAYRKNNSNRLDNDQINKIKAKEREAKETEKRQRKANAFKQWLKNRKINTTNERILATEKRLFEAQYKDGE